MFKHFNFQSKIILANVVIIVLLLGILFVSFYVFVFRQEMERTESDLNTYANKISDDSENLFSEMDRVALQLATNPSIINLFSDIPVDLDSNYFNIEPLKSNALSALVISYIPKGDTYTRIALYNKHDDFFYSGHYVLPSYSLDQYYQSADYTKMQNFFDTGEKNAYIVPSRPDPFSVNAKDTGNVLSLIRQIILYNSFHMPTLGYVEVQINHEQINKMFTFLGPYIKGYLITPDGVIIHLPNNNISTEEISVTDLLSAETIPGYIKARSVIEDNGYTVVLLEEYASFGQSLTRFRYMLILIGLLILSIVTFMEFLIIRRMTLPLKHLKESVDAITIDNLSLKLESHKDFDELNQLNVAFSAVMDELDLAIDDKVKSKTSELKSHLFALQSQMDPHFFHNMLTIISMIAEEHDISEITDICTDLSAMLRFSTAYNSSGAGIGNEIAHTRIYLRLMKTRYENKLNYTIDDKGINPEIPIPKLVLQPLVENCFSHAFKETMPPWTIDIKARAADGYWTLTVIDNGVGFPENVIDDIKLFQQSFQLNRTKDILNQMKIGGLCLTNIYMRIFLMYGKDLTFDIKSKNHLTYVTIGGTYDL